MVVYIFCKKCGKVVDEFEKECFWCKTDSKTGLVEMPCSESFQVNIIEKLLN